MNLALASFLHRSGGSVSIRIIERREGVDESLLARDDVSGQDPEHALVRSDVLLYEDAIRCRVEILAAVEYGPCQLVGKRDTSAASEVAPRSIDDIGSRLEERHAAF